MREQGVVLEDHADLRTQGFVQRLAVASLAVDVGLALEGDGAALDAFEAHQHPEQGTLAATGRADDHQAVVGAHVQVHVVHYQLFAVRLADAAQLDEVAVEEMFEASGTCGWVATKWGMFIAGLSGAASGEAARYASRDLLSRITGRKPGR